ncbi:hypothetical protein [Aliiglaciecola litoralis]|uniref:Bacteriocin-type signal sequence-containing protein n=1 Tax=Aliiglaciecola litoralis TaxID=582857 RepID=A0ABP3X5H4_9ALTE
MEHPFVVKTELNQKQAQSVTGGNAYSQASISVKALGPTPIKPPLGSTMAIGEEGGSFGNWF